MRVVWFKPTNLRLHDTLPLEAHRLAKIDNCGIVHLLALDNKWYSPSSRSRECKIPRIGALRAKFLLEAIHDLESNLRTLKHQLLTFTGSTEEAFRALATKYNIIGVHCQGPDLCSEEQHIERLVEKVIGMPLHKLWGWTLHHIDDLPKWMRRGKKVPNRYKPFSASGTAK